MLSLAFAVCILAQAAENEDGETLKNEKVAVSEALREEYAADAAKYEFRRSEEEPLKLLPKPIMRWSTDDDWSGDVFAWTHDGRPAVVGCILSGPGANGRPVFHEFHLLSDRPLAPVDLHTKRRWQVKAGLESKPVPEGPAPGETKAQRLLQMRQLSRDFNSTMEADGQWELRLLPQPLLRFGEEKGDVIDGALFGYVWPKGTDPELLLLVECRQTKAGAAWHYAPVRFSTRPLVVKYKDAEVWRVESHREPRGTGVTDLPYSSDYARTIPK